MSYLCAFADLGPDLQKPHKHRYRCERCGFEVTASKAPQAECYKSPTLLTAAKSLAAHAIKAAKNPRLASRDEQGRRQEICNTCPLLVNNRCSVCSCYTAGLVKLETFDCPKGKW